MLNKFRQLHGEYIYGEFVILEIKDSGLHPKGGIGIGLATCKKIVENHGGTLSLESKTGEGTTAILLLLIEQANAALSQEAISLQK